MIAVTLNRLIGYGALLSVVCEWLEHDEEDQRHADADGEWIVWGISADGKHWLASGNDEAATRAFAERAGMYLGVPRRGGVL